MVSGGAGVEEGVAQFVGADEGPEGFVDVAADMNEWGAVEAGEIAVHAAQVFKEDLVLQGAGDAEGIPCLMFYGQIIDQLFYLCVIHCIILFLIFVLLRGEFLFRCQLGNTECIFE